MDTQNNYKTKQPSIIFATANIYIKKNGNVPLRTHCQNIYIRKCVYWFIYEFQSNTINRKYLIMADCTNTFTLVIYKYYLYCKKIAFILRLRRLFIVHCSHDHITKKDALESIFFVFGRYEYLLD